MDPFHLCLALGPISVYLLLIGRINLGTRPFVTTGARDTMALAIACSGLAIAGPLELFLPEGLAAFLGAWIWVPLITLYSLCTLLAAMLMRPRLVIYNVSVEQLRPILETVASGLDSERRWAGLGLVMPQRGVQLVVEALPAMRNVQLVAAGQTNQDWEGWRRLERSLRDAVATLRVERNPRGAGFLMFGMLMAATVLYALSQQPAEVAKGLDSFLRR
jgi:hypothetical protein